MEEFHVYMIKFPSGFLYVGQTGNLTRRMREHGPEATLLYTEAFPERWAALLRERQLKGWSRAKKEALAAGEAKVVRAMAKRGARVAVSLEAWKGGTGRVA